MFECFVAIILFVAVVIWLAQLIADGNLNSKINQARQVGNYAELRRLSTERARREENRIQAEAQTSAGTLWMDRIFVLDAAEHGVFAPGAERVFDDPQDWSYTSDQEDQDHQDYLDDFDEPFADPNREYERYDQEGWYPGDDFQPG
jgi:hypothetical protein